MKLREIDKNIYKKNLNIVSVGLVAGLIILSLVFGTGLIAIFGVDTSLANAAEVESTGNFHLNLLGVIFAALVCGGGLWRIKDNPFLAEVYYVWRLKALHNRIYRQLKIIKSAADADNLDALITLSFYYTSLKQVYLLDNNTLTMPKLEKDIVQHEETITGLGLSVSPDMFEESMLSELKTKS
ncbi:conserved hypothetical protein [Shewanella sediminis HAW-EB3]|uniref:DUF3087 domain-containing protein n=1 Tax=Shewanella sediminis (strain HAW-EB3) TaxID=425104 RepID=A8G0B4_SHESH|nr:DUF3087 domain-containing protein [Shewanella sediminis]ABV38537.1 conserved hypothetical protein [Shewanella sediminis HAW-EB3]